MLTFSWLDLVQVLRPQPWLLWVQQRNSPVTSRRSCFPAILSERWLLRSSCLLCCKVPWALGGRGRRKFGTLIYVWLGTSDTPILLCWPVANFCINYRTLGKEAALMITECYDKNLEGSLMLCTFNTVMVVDSPLLGQWRFQYRLMLYFFLLAFLLILRIFYPLIFLAKTLDLSPVLCFLLVQTVGHHPVAPLKGFRIEPSFTAWGPTTDF